MIVVPGAHPPPTPDPSTVTKIVLDTHWKRFYDERVKLIDERDFETLVTTQYHTDAKIISTEYLVSGHGDLVKHFAKYTNLLGFLHVTSTDKWIESETMFAFEATCRTQWGIAKVHDSFFMRDGKIVRHFTGMFPPVRFVR